MSNYCRACGHLLAGEDRFCVNCGQAVEAPTTHPASTSDPKESEGPIYLSSEFPRVISRFFLFDLMQSLSILFLGLSPILIMVCGEEADRWMFLKIWACLVLFIGFLLTMVALLVSGDQSGAVYGLDDQGLTMVIQSKAQPLNELSQWRGILTGNGQMWATDVLTTSAERTQVRWESIQRIVFHPSTGVIELKASSLLMRVHCSNEDYPEVANYITEHCDARASKNHHLPNSLGLHALGWLAFLAYVVLNFPWPGGSDF